VDADPTDPILAQRERIRNRSNTAQRIGYLAYGFATVLFFIGLATSYSRLLVTSIIALLIAGSIVLAIAIQVGYAIRGAERHEVDAKAMRRRR
jgi:hypothetical protein